MARRVYTPDERQQAIALAVEYGPAEAARLTEISSGTIRVWCSRAGCFYWRDDDRGVGVSALDGDES